MGKIVLLILFEIDENLVKALKQRLEQTFKHPVDVKYKADNLEYAYDSRRKQYGSPRLLSRLRRRKKNPDDKIMGVVDVDLYSPGYDFVYGEAEISSGIATLSVYRLLGKSRQRNSVSKLIVARVVREAIHEVGHLYGLGHCTSKCAMRACTCLAEVDKAGNKFCPECETVINKKEV